MVYNTMLNLSLTSQGTWPLLEDRGPKFDPGQSFLHPDKSPGMRSAVLCTMPPTPHCRSSLGLARSGNDTFSLAAPTAFPSPALQTDADSWMTGELQTAETRARIVAASPAVTALR